jgi:sporulation protein YhbH
MSVFREHKTVADRTASDRRRHKQKIEKAIREGIHHIVAEESIISKDGKQKYRIPVRGIKEYRFVYGDNGKQVGSAPGKDVKRGQKIGDPSPQGQGQPQKASNQKGEEYYDVEITHEELAEYLFAELKLPELQKKQLSNIETEKLKRKGYRTEGIQPRLDRKKSAIARIKRMKASGFDPEKAEEGETFSFHEDDLKYRHYKITKKPSTNAVIFFVMDVSGSMSTDKKFLARSFYFLLYQFIRMKYETVEIVFISHDTEAKEVEEKEFFEVASNGGTVASSALELADSIVYKRYHPSSWNIYLFQCSDGDNFSSDNNKFMEYVTKISSYTQLYGYCEIEPETTWSMDAGKLYQLLRPLQGSQLRQVRITKAEDVWPAFLSLMGGKGVSLAKGK